MVCLTSWRSNRKQWPSSPALSKVCSRAAWRRCGLRSGRPSQRATLSASLNPIRYTSVRRWVLLDDLQDVRHLLRLPALDAEVVGDAGCVGGGHPGALQQHHQLADLLVLLPGGEDLRAPRRPDQVHLQQSLRRGVDDVEGVLLELVDDSLGEPWPDALHQARREVPADRVTGGGLDVLAVLGGELVPVGGVVATLPDQPQRLAGLDTQQHRALRGDALPILQAQADHGEAGAVDEHDPLDDPLHAFPRHGYAHTHTPCS